MVGTYIRYKVPKSDSLYRLLQPAMINPTENYERFTTSNTNPLGMAPDFTERGRYVPVIMEHERGHEMCRGPKPITFPAGPKG